MISIPKLDLSRSALSPFFDRVVGDVGIDLGTANTLVYLRGAGIVLREPSVIARSSDGRVLAVGEEAKQMIGRTPAYITATRPLKGGVIAEFETTTAMLSYFVKRAVQKRVLLRPRIIIGIPTEATTVEKRALVEAAAKAGARSARLIEEPMAAALGVGLPIAEPTASAVVDIGGGRTQVAVISLGGIVTRRSIRVAGDEMDEAILEYARRTHNLLIGERTAEEVKIALGSAYPIDRQEPTKDVRGRDLVSGLPRTLKISAGEIREALAQPVQAIVEAVRQTLEQTPPELSADIMTRGIVMVGGGALLRGLDRLLAEETGMPVALSDDPLSAVALGTGVALEARETLKRVLISAEGP
jgi:rod shape-determining protein MreB